MKPVKDGTSMDDNTTAAGWFVRLRSDRARAETDAAFLAWLRLSPEHEADYSLCEFTEVLTRELADDPELEPHLAECRELARRHRHPPGQRPRAGLRGALSRPRAFAAAVVCAGVLGVAAMLHFDDPTYATAVGEQRTIQLPDGSQLALNTDTSLSVDYSSKQRRIHLDRGEAFFTVARDPLRQFVVLAGDGVARAVGTSFGVAIRDDEVKVSVLEGTVEVDVPVQIPGAGMELQQAKTLSGGEAVKYWSSGAIAQVEEADTRRINAWREGKLAFDGMRLVDVVNEHNRYTARKIVLGSDDIKNMAVSGMFAIGDTDALIFLLEHSLGLEAIRQFNVIVLTRPSLLRPADAEHDAPTRQATPPVDGNRPDANRA